MFLSNGKLVLSLVVLAISALGNAASEIVTTQETSTPMYLCVGDTPLAEDFSSEDKQTICGSYDCHVHGEKKCWMLEGDLVSEEEKAEFETLYYCSHGEDDDEPDVYNIIQRGDEDKEVRCGYYCYFSSGKCWKLASDGADGDFEVSEEEMELDIDSPLYTCSSGSPSRWTVMENGIEDKETACGYDCHRYSRRKCWELGSDGNITQVDKAQIEPLYYCSYKRTPTLLRMMLDGNKDKEESCGQSCSSRFGNECWKLDDADADGSFSHAEISREEMQYQWDIEPMYYCVSGSGTPNHDTIYSRGNENKETACGKDCHQYSSRKCWELRSDGSVTQVDKADIEPLYYCSQRTQETPYYMIEYGIEDKESACGYDCHRYSSRKCWELGSDGNITQVDKADIGPLFRCYRWKPSRYYMITYGNNDWETTCGYDCHRSHKKCWMLGSDNDSEVTEVDKVEFEPLYYCSTAKPYIYTLIKNADGKEEEICNSSCSSSERCWKLESVDGAAKVSEVEEVVTALKYVCVDVENKPEDSTICKVGETNNDDVCGDECAHNCFKALCDGNVVAESEKVDRKLRGY